MKKSLLFSLIAIVTLCCCESKPKDEFDLKYVKNETLDIYPSIFMESRKLRAEMLSNFREKVIAAPDNFDQLNSEYKAGLKRLAERQKADIAEVVKKIDGKEVPFRYENENPYFDVRSIKIKMNETTDKLMFQLDVFAKQDMEASSAPNLVCNLLDKDGVLINGFPMNLFALMDASIEKIAAGEQFPASLTWITPLCTSFDYTQFAEAVIL